MEYAMRNIVGTSIVYEIQALFRPAGGGGIKRQCTTVWATFWWNKIDLEGGKNLTQYLSLASVHIVLKPQLISQGKIMRKLTFEKNLA